MGGITRDTVVAIVLLLFCGVVFAATFNIRETAFASMGSEVWPRVVIVFLTFLCLIYLAQSLRAPAGAEAGAEREGGGLRAWLHKYQNALWCYVLFLAFLVTLPYFGMLIGGSLFVFLTLTTIGRRDPRGMLIHAAIAAGSVGFMWSIFTFALRVILPEGELIRIW